MLSIAIDGPGGAGKSTIAKRLATELGLEYIDTGAMYRAAAFKAIRDNVDIYNHDQLNHMLEDTDIDFVEGKILLDGNNVSDMIRTPEISKKASDISAIAAVRKKLVALQRQMGAAKDVIMDGRDIGTNVLTDATYKFFLTADPKIRAQRRYEELLAKGEAVNFEDVLSDIMIRDKNDTERENDPLRKADDAVEVDTSYLDIDGVTKKLLQSIVRE